jgi:hypothetical protein
MTVGQLVLFAGYGQLTIVDDLELGDEIKTNFTEVVLQ